ncbi:MAG TPA: aminomethyl-transferring glycine dehydrogenase subunit GcvPA [Dehalococcoidia bacterium]|nr:aminomethyl-transferring glycine dehydrogenase subunit GcvPA [Dehalococcoidia bacterium]
MSSPYVPNVDADRQEMLKAIGVSTVDELFKDVPKKFLNAEFKLPPPLSELELKEKLRQIASKNVNTEEYACFLGAGFYQHFIPSVIHHVTGRSEFYTAYTPYQAEASQGTLQSIYEYQSMICQLTGMEISNASMYECGSAAAEAALMACRITKRNKVVVLSTVNPRYYEVISTYTREHGIELERVDAASAVKLGQDYACLIVQYPTFLGYFEDLGSSVQTAHESGALLVAIASPFALAMYKSPGSYGADIVVGEGQALGNPMSFGGPGLGFFACRNEYLRQMPGRLVGKTVDSDGQPGFVLTISTREQHIKRERATSNICTNEGLVALATMVYIATLGEQGLRHVAELCYHKAHYAEKELSKLKGYSSAFNKPFFNEFVLRCPREPRLINEALFEQKIIGGLDISNIIPNGMLICVTEVNTKADIDRLVKAAARF